MARADVMVVGGGPAGCYAASLLALKGLDVHVLEEHATIGDPVDCSGVVGADSFASLDLPNSLVLGEVNSLTLVSPSQLKIRFSPSSPLAYIVDRAGLDRAIADRARIAGALFHLGTRVVDLHVWDDCVELEVIRQTSNVNRQSHPHPSPLPGREREGRGSPVDQLPLTNNSRRSRVRARVVILAGGPRYRLQRKLGMGEPVDFLRTAQTEVAIRGIEETEVLMGSQVAPGSFGWIVPFRKGDDSLARIGVSAKRNPGPYIRKILERLHSRGYLSSRDLTLRSWIIPISPLKRTYADRVLAAGDAAGQTKPITGGGIYFGLLCAEEAARTVAEAFRKGNFRAASLRSYEKGWQRRLGPEIRAGAFFRRLAERLSDNDIDDLFRIVQSDGILSAVTAKARFDWHKDVIRFALRHPALGRIFLRGLFR